MNNSIPKDKLETVCKRGQGADCCRFISFGTEGWTCEKYTNVGTIMNARVEMGTMGSKGDNCDGLLPDWAVFSPPPTPTEKGN